MQIFDRKTIAIPGPTADASPAVIESARQRATETATSTVRELLPDAAADALERALDNPASPGGVALAAAVSETARPVATATARDFLASDAGVAASAIKAVDNVINGRSLVESAEPIEGGPAIAIPFEDGSRNALEVGTDGRPTALSVALHVEAEAALMGATLGIETRSDLVVPDGVRVAFVFETGELAGTIRDDGTMTFGQASTSTRWPAIARGDSTTYGADLAAPTTERWTTLLADRIGRTIDNWGRSGARSEEITFLAGALTIRATPSGTLPAAGTVTLTDLTVDPWRSGPTNSVRVTGIADNGATFGGVLSPSGDTRVLTVDSTSTGSAITTASIILRASVDESSRVLFLGQGINNEPLIVSGSQTIEHVKAWYRAVTSRHTGPLVIWGVLDRGTSEAPGSKIGDYIAELERWLASEYGDAYYPLRQYLATPQALLDAELVQPGFTAGRDAAAVAADKAAQDAGTVPPSFRSGGGSVHLNALGHKLQARYLHRQMILRGLL